MVTYKAKGVVPDAAPHFAGVFTNGAIERPMIDEADLLHRRRPRSRGAASAAVDLRAADRPHRRVRASTIDTSRLPRSWSTDIPAGIQLVGELLPPSAWDLDAVRRTRASRSGSASVP